MNYISTRNKNTVVESAYAIKQGLSSEGGLFVPENFPKITLSDINMLKECDYRQRAMWVLERFLTDFTHDELLDCVNSAYNENRFSSEKIAPLHKLNDSVSILELWHGPTCAFKDMALQILPKFMTYSMKKSGSDDTVVILVATSGDTGKAALEGFSDVEGTKIIVFYPDNGVSRIQKLQMVTQRGSNVSVCAVKGNFDDAQNGVKEIFTHSEYLNKLKQKCFVLSSANSINWGRLVPQIVYYISAYCDLVDNAQIALGDKINICVPTGNFGNILAAYYAKSMGLPVNKLVCASNSNNVLTDFINTGLYEANRKFFSTISPSMDILVSSNLERLLFHLSGNDDNAVKKMMGELKSIGRFKVDDEVYKKIKSLIYANCCDDTQTLETISRIKAEYNYVCDTHTAVAVKVYSDYVNETGDKTKTVIASTASPFKFNESVIKAINKTDILKEKDEFELLSECEKLCNFTAPKSLTELKKLPIRFENVCEKGKQEAFVSTFLKI